MALPSLSTPPPRLGRSAWKAKNPGGNYNRYSMAYNRKFGTTAGLTPHTGYEGPGVQDLINQGQMPYGPLSTGNLGYTPPPVGATGPAITPPKQSTEDLIKGHWRVTGAQTAGAKTMADARTNYRTALRQALINMGIADASQLPGELGQFSEYIDNDTIKSAVNNRFSTTAQLQQQATRAQAQNEASLAARGMLSSGQTVKSTQDVLGAQQQGGWNALQEFLSGGTEGLGQLGTLQAGVDADIAEATGLAGDEIALQYPDVVGGSAPAAAAAAAPQLLSQRAWLARNPGGTYANYVRAFRRHQRQA